MGNLRYDYKAATNKILEKMELAGMSECMVGNMIAYSEVPEFARKEVMERVKKALKEKSK